MQVAPVLVFSMILFALAFASGQQSELFKKMKKMKKKPVLVPLPKTSFILGTEQGKGEVQFMPGTMRKGRSASARSQSVKIDFDVGDDDQKGIYLTNDFLKKLIDLKLCLIDLKLWLLQSLRKALDSGSLDSSHDLEITIDKVAKQRNKEVTLTLGGSRDSDDDRRRKNNKPSTIKLNLNDDDNDYRRKIPAWLY